MSEETFTKDNSETYEEFVKTLIKEQVKELIGKTGQAVDGPEKGRWVYRMDSLTRAGRSTWFSKEMFDSQKEAQHALDEKAALLLKCINHGEVGTVTKEEVKIH